MRPTRAQSEALVLLEQKPRATTKNTHHGYVGGQTMAALLRRGWARQVSVAGPGGERMYDITASGFVALHAWDLARSL